VVRVLLQVGADRQALLDGFSESLSAASQWL
jgi:hypothetical protein